MKKLLAFILVFALIATLSVSAFADVFVEGYFTNPAGAEASSEATVSCLKHNDAERGDKVIAYFDKLEDAFSNVDYLADKDEIYLDKSDASTLKFPLEAVGQGFYMVIDKASDVAFTGEVTALPYYVVAAIADCAEEIGLDPEAFDVTHYLVVAFAPPAGGNGGGGDEPTPGPGPDPDPDPETKPAPTGQITVDKSFLLLPGKNVTIRWMLPTKNDDGSYDAPGLAITYDKFAEDGTIVVGNPAVANGSDIDGQHQEITSGNTTVGFDVGTSQVPVDQDPAQVGVDVNDLDEHTDVTVTAPTEEKPLPVSYNHYNETAQMVLEILGALLNNITG